MLDKNARYHERQFELGTASVYVINMANIQESGVLLIYLHQILKSSKNYDFYHKCCFQLCTVFTKESFKGLQTLVNGKHKNTFTIIVSGSLIPVIHALRNSRSFHTHT
jgi:hypothetical protein